MTIRRGRASPVRPLSRAAARLVSSLGIGQIRQPVPAVPPVQPVVREVRQVQACVRTPSPPGSGRTEDTSSRETI